jgi:hypothetical protein
MFITKNANAIRLGEDSNVRPATEQVAECRTCRKHGHHVPASGAAAELGIFLCKRHLRGMKGRGR